MQSLLPSTEVLARGLRWEVVVADAHGLTREQYAHVLSTFRHRSYPRAPELCLAKFDELKATGLEAFTRKYDPYWDVPLNGRLPEPVIELPDLPEPRRRGDTESGDAAGRNLLGDVADAHPRRGRRARD